MSQQLGFVRQKKPLTAQRPWSPRISLNLQYFTADNSFVSMISIPVSKGTTSNKQKITGFEDVGVSVFFVVWLSFFQTWGFEQLKSFLSFSSFIWRLEGTYGKWINVQQLNHIKHKHNNVTSLLLLLYIACRRMLSQCIKLGVRVLNRCCFNYIEHRMTLIIMVVGVPNGCSFLHALFRHQLRCNIYVFYF